MELWVLDTKSTDDDTQSRFHICMYVGVCKEQPTRNAPRGSALVTACVENQPSAKAI